MIWALAGALSISKAETPRALEADEIYEASRQAVFYVRAFRADGTLRDVGTGFVIDPNGTSLTAAHVVEGAERIACVLGEGEAETELACAMAAMDAEADTAVLQLPAGWDSTESGAKAAPLKLRSSPMKHGERLYVIGFPMKGTKIVTEGLVNSPAAPINGHDRMLVSAQIVNGMSGGPALDRYGYVAGLISGSLRTMAGIHLVVDSQTASTVMECTADRQTAP